MIVEIRQAGFVNKGAELMLHAAVQKIRQRYPDAKLTMAPVYGGAPDTYEKMGELKLYPKAWLWRKGFDFGQFGVLIPKRLRTIYGLVLTNEIDVVIDAAGFSYSDQWGVNSSRELASSSKKWKKNGTKLILLPQALGPYTKPGIKKYVAEWANNADMIFAREEDSYQYLTGVVGDQDKIKLYRDFTNLVIGELPVGYDPSDKKVALVPNYRMIDKTSKEESEAYLSFMIKCAKYLVEKQSKPFVLVHEGENDRMLAQKISEAVGGIPIVTETDPLKIKGILGSCEATVGSRFHGLVSALSQGVPSLATGWSHKYRRLFEDYDFSDGVVSVLDTEEKIREKIDLIVGEDNVEPLKQKLKERSEVLKQQSEEMWEHVFYHMDQKT